MIAPSSKHSQAMFDRRSAYARAGNCSREFRRRCFSMRQPDCRPVFVSSGGDALGDWHASWLRSFGLCRTPQRIGSRVDLPGLDLPIGFVLVGKGRDPLSAESSDTVESCHSKEQISDVLCMVRKPYPAVRETRSSCGALLPSIASKSRCCRAQRA